VTAVRIIRDKVTGAGKGFGYVTFSVSGSQFNVKLLLTLTMNLKPICATLGQAVGTSDSRAILMLDKFETSLFISQLPKHEKFQGTNPQPYDLQASAVIHRPLLWASDVGDRIVVILGHW